MALMDRLIGTAAPAVKHRLWIVSDLQQQYPERATYCMTRAMDDFVSLGMPVEAAFYLGDATEGPNPEFIRQMAQMQAEQFARIDAPVYYSVGNHDFDYFRSCGKELGRMVIPFVDYMRQFPQWHVPEDMLKMYSIIDMGDYAVCLLTDHAAPDGSWHTTHGAVWGDAEAYPYDEEDYRAVMREVEALHKPVITMSHYAYPGGNREAELFRRFLPLPENIMIHLYGHAHIGDAQWAGKDCYRKIAAVDDQAVKQINVASLENYRGSAVRSVILEWYADDELGILFRNHSRHCWDDYLIIRKGDCLRDPIDQHERP